MTDDAIQSAFLALLPYYWWNAADLPARVKLILLINRWPSVAVACLDLTGMPIDVRIRRKQLIVCFIIGWRLMELVRR